MALSINEDTFDQYADFLYDDVTGWRSYKLRSHDQVVTRYDRGKWRGKYYVFATFG